jgi:hypothetical protein
VTFLLGRGSGPTSQPGPSRGAAGGRAVEAALVEGLLASFAALVIGPAASTLIPSHVSPARDDRRLGVMMGELTWR